MARVLVIGAGLAGLACALEATTAGHHVVVLERASRIGGRGTSQNIDGLPVGFGPHLFLKKGPFHNLAQIGIKMKVSPIQLIVPKLWNCASNRQYPIVTGTQEVTEEWRFKRPNHSRMSISFFMGLATFWRKVSCSSKKETPRLQ